jgi:hypothetical protein
MNITRFAVCSLAGGVSGRNNDGEDADALAALHGVSAKIVAYLLGQLRATPRSRMGSRAAGPEVEGAPKFRPWDIRA